MSNLSDALGALSGARRPGPSCGIARLLKSLEGTPDEKNLREYLDNPEITATSLAAVLTKECGVLISDKIIQRHRRRGTGRGCACTK